MLFGPQTQNLVSANLPNLILCEVYCLPEGLREKRRRVEGEVEVSGYVYMYNNIPLNY